MSAKIYQRAPKRVHQTGKHATQEKNPPYDGRVLVEGGIVEVDHMTETAFCSPRKAKGNMRGEGWGDVGKKK